MNVRHRVELSQTERADLTAGRTIAIEYRWSEGRPERNTLNPTEFTQSIYKSSRPWTED